MARVVKSVPVSLINLRNRKYQFSIPVSLKTLIRSIDRNGIIHPVVLVRESGLSEYSVVCGYKRVLAAMKLGISEVEALAPHSGGDAVNLFYMNVTDTLSQRELHFIENGNILRMLRDNFNITRGELVSYHMKQLGLNPSGFLLDRLLSISSFDSSVKRFIVRYKIPLHVSEHFLRFTSGEISSIVRILSRLRFGTNKVREFLTFIKEISIRDNLSPLEIIDNYGLNNIGGESSGSSAGAGDAVRKILYRERFPVTEKLETEFQELVDALSLPDEVSVSHSKNFEESVLKISIAVKGAGKIAGLARTLNDLGGREQFQKLFDL